MDITAKDRTLDYRDGDLRIVGVGAAEGGEAFLLISGQRAALFEAGFSFCAPRLADNLEAELGGRALDYILLSHSHYDHASGAYFLKKRFKDAKIVASRHAATILSKPSAVAAMRELNEGAAALFGWDAGEPMGKIDVDICVSEGDMIDLGGETLRAMEAPGHTKCCVSFYMPEKKLLLACETLGCPARPGLVLPCYIVGYEISVNHIKRLLDMDIDMVLAPHYGLLRGKACRRFLQDALRSAVGLKDMILAEHGRGKSFEEIAERYGREYYSERLRRIQPPTAFRLNASHMIPMVIRECSPPA